MSAGFDDNVPEPLVAIVLGALIVAALAAGASVAFTVNNTLVVATDTIIIHRVSGGTAGAYNIWVDSVSASTFVVYVRNITPGALSEAPVLNFSIIKAVAA